MPARPPSRSRRSLIAAGAGLVASALAGCTSAATEATTTTERYQTGVAPGNRLVLRATDDLVVRVTTYEDDAETERLADREYELEDGVGATVDEFEPSGWIVVRLDDERIWQGYVGSADHYELTVHPDGEVDVEHWVK